MQRGGSSHTSRGRATTVADGRLSMTTKKRCMICGIREPEGSASMCEPCKDQLRREAMGEQDKDRRQADRALHEHGTKTEGR